MKYVKRMLIVAGAVALAGILAVAFVPKVAHGLVAALVENIDEPGRNPYQEGVFVDCPGSQFCNFFYSAVPTGKRLVLTDISGFIDVDNGTLPNGILSSSSSASSAAFQAFTGVTGNVFSGGGTRIFINQRVQAYFGAGEIPHVFLGLASTSDSFKDGGEVAISGYYVSAP
jgi:hypothetical protein